MEETKHTNIITVQLTVPALMRLFEGDPEIGLTLRKGVIAAFAKAKIGTILDAASKAQVASEITKQVGEIKGYPQKITLQQGILDTIKSEASKAMKDADKQVRALIDESISNEKEAIEKMIASEVKRRITAEVADKVKSEVRSRLNAALSAAQV